MGCSQNAGALKMEYKITFKLCAYGNYKMFISEFLVWTWIPIPRYHIIFTEIFQNVKKSELFLVPSISDTGTSHVTHDFAYDPRML
jgi:hypothetical protein